jgi:hypothetical protein
LAEHHKKGYEALVVSTLRNILISTIFTTQGRRESDIHMREINGNPHKRTGLSITIFSLNCSAH